MMQSTMQSMTQSVQLNGSKAPVSESVSAIADSNLEQEKQLDFKETYQAAINKKSEHQQQEMQQQSVKRAWQDKAEALKAERQKNDNQTDSEVKDDVSLSSEPEQAMAIEQDAELTQQIQDEKSTGKDILAQIQAAQQQIRPKQQAVDKDSDSENSKETASETITLEQSDNSSKPVPTNQAHSAINTPLNPISQLLADLKTMTENSEGEQNPTDGKSNPLSSLSQLTPELTDQSDKIQSKTLADKSTKVIAVEQINTSKAEVSEPQKDNLAASNEKAQQSSTEKLVSVQAQLSALTQEAKVEEAKDQKSQDKKPLANEEQASNARSFDKLVADSANTNPKPESKFIEQQIANAKSNQDGEPSSVSANKELKQAQGQVSAMPSTAMNETEDAKKSLSQEQAEQGKQALEKQKNASLIGADTNNQVKLASSIKVSQEPDKVVQAKNETSALKTKEEALAGNASQVVKLVPSDNVGQTLTSSHNSAIKQEPLSASDVSSESTQTRPKLSAELPVDNSANKEGSLGDKVDTKAVLKQQGKELAAQAELQDSNARESLVKEQTQAGLKGQGTPRDTSMQPSPMATAPQPMPANQVQAQAQNVGGLGQHQVFAASINATGASQTQGAAATSLNAFEVSQKFELAAKEAPSVLRERITMMINKGVTQAEIKLDPAELGSMHVKLSMQNDQLSINVQTTQPQSKELVEQHMPRLRELLSQQGINLGESHVGQQQSGSKETNQSLQQGSGSAQTEQQLANANEVELKPTQNYVRSNSAIDYYA
ncbi:flagellar hook-length control protein FliK [Motilimonas sp. KMU-193]|uniref:flagellar hook-length control protein FliK n=1 Tax=Motilimonas sp. KMU-193 TaxID=3388668 RepID=UPI00396B3119